MQHNLAIFISGSGTTMQAIIRAVKRDDLKMKISCIISSNINARGIKKADKLGVDKKDIIVIDPENYREGGKVNQQKFGEDLLKQLKKRKVTVFIQCGWMPLTPKIVIENYIGFCFNQHPGPVPDFGGKGMFGRRVHATVLLFRKKTNQDFWTEVVCQRVGVEFDAGKVVKSARVKILTTDSVEDLQKRCLPIEHKVQIGLLKDLAEENITEERRLSYIQNIEEKSILEDCKNTAEMLYPNG